jgi:hypothetical protein
VSREIGSGSIPKERSPAVMSRRSLVGSIAPRWAKPSGVAML